MNLSRHRTLGAGRIRQSASVAVTEWHCRGGSSDTPPLGGGRPVGVTRTPARGLPCHRSYQ